jgi:AraC-like DNA-binding protein
MSGFHGTWLKTLETSGFIFTWTRFESIGTLSPHMHDRAYASLVLDGSYTELQQFSPRWCVPGTAIVHEAGEVHADHFHERCVVLNAQAKRDDVPRAVLARELLQFAPAFAVAVASEPEGASNLPLWVVQVCELFARDSHATPRRAAALAGKHPADFSRAFRKLVGLTPGSFQRRARVRRAVSLLLTSDLRLAHVAQECGFSDQSHFAHAFLRETGMPPQRFAAAFAC